MSFRAVSYSVLYRGIITCGKLLKLPCFSVQFGKKKKNNDQPWHDTLAHDDTLAHEDVSDRRHLSTWWCAGLPTPWHMWMCWTVDTLPHEDVLNRRHLCTWGCAGQPTPLYLRMCRTADTFVLEDVLDRQHLCTWGCAGPSSVCSSSVVWTIIYVFRNGEGMNAVVWRSLKCRRKLVQLWDTRRHVRAWIYTS